MFKNHASATDNLRLSRVPLILMYHRVAEGTEDPLCVTPARFAEQMTWLKRHGMRGVGVGSLVDAMRAGRQRGLVGITFDDGFVELVEEALPALLRHEFSATMFVCSGLLGGNANWDDTPPWELMSGDQVRELARAGMEIGSHSVTHLRMRGAPADLIKSELRESKASLGELIDAPIRGFAYPYGSMDGAAQNAVRDAGYDYACAVMAPTSQLGFMTLPRMFAAECDGAGRMAAKRLLFKPYFAVHGRHSDA